MPIKQGHPFRQPPGAAQLSAALATEWRNPNPTALEPVIIEEGRPQPTRLYVVWSRWDGLNMQERSEVIMDAYEAARGSSAALDVTVAMGLTPEEADRMNVDWR